MGLYLYEFSYTSAAMAALVKDPQDRIDVAAKPLATALGGHVVAGGYAFGAIDVVLIVEMPDDVSMPAFVTLVSAGGSLSHGKTTKLMDGASWVSALTKAQHASPSYTPAR